MKKLQKAAALLLVFTLVIASPTAALATPVIDNSFTNYQQVILDRVNAQVITIQQIAINVALNISPTVNVNVDLKKIGPKF